MTGNPLGDRYEVGRVGARRYGVFDIAETRGDPLEVCADEFDAVLACQRRNAAYHAAYERKAGARA